MKRSILLLSLALPIVMVSLWFASRPLAGKSDRRVILYGRQSILVERILDSMQRLPTRILAERFLQTAFDNPSIADSYESLFRPASADQLPKGLTLPEDPFVLTFPQTPSGRAGALAIGSTVILINNSGVTAHGEIIFRGQNGAAMTVSTNLGSGDHFEFTLAKGEVVRLETVANGTLTVGWVEVRSDAQISGSATFTVFDQSDAVLSEVGIGDSVRVDKLLVFVDSRAGKRTGYAVANPGAGAVHLTYTLKTMAGQVVTRKEQDLSALNQTVNFVDELFKGVAGVDFSNFRGVLLIESEGGDVSVVTLRTRGTNYTSLPAVPVAVVDPDADDYTLIFARIGDGVFGSLLFNSSFILLNNSDQVVDATVELFREDGSPFPVDIEGAVASSFQTQVPAGGAVELVTPGETNPGAVGWARVTSSLPLAGSAAFTIQDKTTQSFISEVGVPNSPPNVKPAILVREQGPVSTGVGLTNPNEQSVQVRLRLVEGTEGVSQASSASTQSSADFEVDRVLAERVVDIPANSHIGLFAAQLFPDVQEIKDRNFEGRLLMESFFPVEGAHDILVPLSGITLVTRGTLFTSLPTAPYIQNFGPEATFEPATLRSGSQPRVCFSVRQLDGEIPVDQSTFTLDQGSFDFSVLEDSGVFGNLSTQVFATYLLNGFVFLTDEVDHYSFYSYITFDGVSEAVPGIGTLSNLPGGGVEIQLVNNGQDTDPLPIVTRASLCFDSTLLRLPENPTGPLTFRASYTSKPAGDAETVWESREGRYFELEPEDAAGPEIDSVSPARVTGGMEIEIDGTHLNGAQETVTVGGRDDLFAEILESGPDVLRVRLPEALSSGSIVVHNAAGTSNPYQLEVVFAPAIDLEFGSMQAGAQTTFDFSLAQAPGEIVADRVNFDVPGGQWTVGGLSPGDQIGTAVQTTAATETTNLLLIVREVDSDSAVIDLVQEAGDDPDYVIEMTTEGGSARLALEPPEPAGLTQRVLGTSLHVDLSAPILRVPASGFAVGVEAISQPERILTPETAFRVESTREFEVN